MMRAIRDWFKKENKSTLEQYLEAIIIVVPIAFIIRTVGFGLYVVPSGSMEHTMLVGERYFSDKLTPYLTPIQRGEIIALNDPTYRYSHNRIVNWFQRYVWGPSNWTKRVIGIPGDHLKGVIEQGRPVVYIKQSGSNEWEKVVVPQVNTLPLIYLWTKHAPTQQDMYLGNYGIDVRTFDPARTYQEQEYYRVMPHLVIHDMGNVFPDAIYNRELQCYLNMPDTPLANGDDVFDIELGPNQYWLMGDNRKGSRDSRDWGPCDGSLIHGRIRARFFSIQYAAPWSFGPFDESWLILDLLLHPIDFWHRIRWNRVVAVL